MNEFEKFTADVHNAFELLGGKKSYDSFVALISASARQDEQERIIKLLKNDLLHFIIGGETIVLKGKPLKQPIEWLHADSCTGCLAIALIKGENK